MLEALVTLGILSVALMGLAFLQAQGMQLNTSAYSRTQGSILVGDIVDKMRLNAGNLNGYDTASFSPDLNPSACDPTSAPDPDNDRNCWYQRLDTALPGGDGDIAVNPATRVVTVTVRWTERPSGRRDDSFDPGSLTAAELDELQVQQMIMSAAL